jgi:hypothetical protein
VPLTAAVAQFVSARFSAMHFSSMSLNFTMHVKKAVICGQQR